MCEDIRVTNCIYIQYRTRNKRLTRANCTASARSREFHAQTVKINLWQRMFFFYRGASLFRFDRIPRDATDTQTAAFAFSTKNGTPKYRYNFFFRSRGWNFELSNIFPDEGLILGFNSETQSYNGARWFFLASHSWNNFRVTAARISSHADK